MNNQNLDLPITALCIVADRQKCPPNYTPIVKSHDSNTEIDLWKDGLFSKNTTRYICYTKDYPIANVIEILSIFTGLSHFGRSRNGIMSLFDVLETKSGVFRCSVFKFK